jgi:hypothetical protein
MLACQKKKNPKMHAASHLTCNAYCSHLSMHVRPLVFLLLENDITATLWAFLISDAAILFCSQIMHGANCLTTSGTIPSAYSDHVGCIC